MAVEAKTAGVQGNKVVKYLKDVKSELKKITWPSKNDIVKSTGAVLLCLVIFSVILAIYDSVFGYVLKTVLNYIK
jgi:preprotein translocase subunit SecE